MNRFNRFMIVVAGVVGVSSILGAESTPKRDLPDARTWQFFSEQKLRSRLFFVTPGAPDSIFVSDEPACCPAVASNGLWIACTNFNRKAIENELLLVSRGLDRWRPLPGYTAISYRWSPDGVMLAGYGKRRTAASVCFFVVDPTARSSWIADSLLSPEDYEFAWDSTSSRVAVCCPATSAQATARVIVFSVPDKKVRVAADLSDAELSNPRWASDGALLVTKTPSSGLSSTDLRLPLPER